jgi:CRISPR-associated endoribonuclease cas2
MEISPGVFVGTLSARVRERLWDIVTDNMKTGRAVMVYRARNEQGLEFLTWGDPWKPVDFDGLTLMMRPYYSEGRGQYSEPDPAARQLRKRPAMSNFQKRCKAQGFPRSDRSTR